MSSENISKSNPVYLLDSAAKLEEFDIPLMWLGFININYRVYYNSKFAFAAALMDMCSRNIFHIDQFGIRVNNQSYCDDPVIAKYDNFFIEILKRNIYKNDGLSLDKELFISFTNLNKIYENTKSSSDFYSEIESWLKDYRKNYKKSSKYNQLLSNGSIRKIKKELTSVCAG